jgi:antitoxin (DNA-binding transcriptional repressor) of toxin-antitoxin stability system
MSETVTLQEAQAHLADLIAKLVPGEEVVVGVHDIVNIKGSRHR